MINYYLNHARKAVFTTNVGFLSLSLTSHGGCHNCDVRQRLYCLTDNKCNEERRSKVYFLFQEISFGSVTIQVLLVGFIRRVDHSCWKLFFFLFLDFLLCFQVLSWDPLLKFCFLRFGFLSLFISVKTVEFSEKIDLSSSGEQKRCQKFSESKILKFAASS